MNALVLSLSVILTGQATADHNMGDTYIDMDQNIALSQSGYISEEQLENDHGCGPLHEQGDAANDWCHGRISEGIYEVLKERGVSDPAAHASALLFWLFKEYVLDLNADKRDIVTAPFTFRSRSGMSKVRIQCRFDGTCTVKYSLKY